MPNSKGTETPGPLSPEGATMPLSPHDKSSRRKKGTRILSKVRFREIETCSDDESEVRASRGGPGGACPSFRGGITRSPRGAHNGHSLGSHVAISPSKPREPRKKHLGSDDRVRTEVVAKRHSKYSPGKGSSRRLSLGLLPPTLQSVRNMSSSTRNNREAESFQDRRKSIDIIRSHSDRHSKESRRQSSRDEARVRSWGNRKKDRTPNVEDSVKCERGSIEAIFRTTSTFSNSESDSISLKGFFQNLIALENETL